jgi:ABC-2 type transport system ATP-binding protein
MMAAIIEARDLVKRFDRFTAVDHISFAVEAGVIFGFLGPNGAGKTTTIKMLTTVLTPSEGRLSIAGHDPVKEPLLVRREARLAANPEPHDKRGCERNFRNQLEYDEVGVITKRIHQQK